MTRERENERRNKKLEEREKIKGRIKTENVRRERKLEEREFLSENEMREYMRI